MSGLIGSYKCKPGDMMEAINFLSVRRISLKKLRFEIRRFQPKICLFGNKRVSRSALLPVLSFYKNG